MGPHTVSKVIPTKKIHERAKDETNHFKEYWTDYNHSSNYSVTTTPVPPRFKNQILQDGASVADFSRKRNFLGDDNEDYNKYRTKGKSVNDSLYRIRSSGSTDSAYRTRETRLTNATNSMRPSDLTDASNFKHLSGLTDASNHTRPLSLRENYTTFRESSDSDAPENREYIESFNCSNIVEDNLTSPSLKSRNAAFKSYHPTMPSPRKTSQKKHLVSSSKSLKNIDNISEDCLSKVVTNSMVQEEIVPIKPEGKISHKISKTLDTSLSRLLKTGSISPNEELKIMPEKKCPYSTSTAKRKINVKEMTENNHEYLEQELELYNSDSEINTPMSKMSKCLENNSFNVPKNKDKTQQISSKRRLIDSDGGKEIYCNAQAEVSLERNATDEAAANTYQYFPSKKPSKYKKLCSSNFLTTKMKIPGAKNSERYPENIEKMSEARELEPELSASRKKILKKNREKEVEGVPLRRSKRNRIAPLKYWANERRLFAKNYNGEIISLGIDPGTGEDDECQRYLQKMQEKRRQAKKKEKKARKTIPKTSSVFNSCTGKFERVVLHVPFDNITWMSPFSVGGNEVNASFYLSKPFRSSKLMFGFLKIQPRETKPSQTSSVGSIYFLVAKGQVEVTINDTVLKLKQMDSLIVPKYQTHSIKNLLNSYALLSFCAFKVPFFDFELK